MPINSDQEQWKLQSMFLMAWAQNAPIDSKKNMKILILFALLLASHAAMASCNVSAASSGPLQWSDPATISSPDHMWQVEVHPILTSDYNETPVSLRDCRANKLFKLFTLERSAKLYWSPNSSGIFVINQPTSDNYQLLYFQVESLTGGMDQKASSTLDENAKKAIANQVGEDRRIKFYLPSYVSWVDDKVTLEIGGTTSPNGDGPMAPYCYGVVIDTSTKNVTSILSQAELRQKFKNVACHIFP